MTSDKFTHPQPGNAAPANPTTKQESSPLPAITLPKGGGAIRGMGEKFAANPVTGTGSLNVPIVTSPGRSGFGPQLSLSYDSGAGNGPFGFGWSLSIPSISRKTDKGLPQYLDGEESDVFILSGAEDLVPEFKKDDNGRWTIEDGKYVILDEPRTVNNVRYRVRHYRPRIEGLFARIERWTNTLTPQDVCWRSISKDNVTTWYGKSEDSRIVDPADPTHIFSWMICESYDDKGNMIVYEYKRENAERVFEDAQGKPITLTNERNREPTANRYIKRIRYGNHQSYLPKLDANQSWPIPPSEDSWFFEVVFDYGEHDTEAPQPSDDLSSNSQGWPRRNDPFSSYRSRFEIRTYRLCQRILMFHHFPGEDDIGNNCLVRSTDFTYSDEQDPNSARNPVYTFLCAVTQSGYKRDNGGYLKRSLPPVEFEYSQPIVQDTVEDVDTESLENLPIGLDGAVYQWADLHGEGIPGILTEQANAWFYKRNLSPIGTGSVKFAPLESVAIKPNFALAGGQAQFMDLAGDGQPDLAVLDGSMPGLYEHDGNEGWQPFRPFTSCLNYNTRDPNLKFVDLDGDGHADVLITEDEAFVWHPSLAEQGFGPARRVQQARDEEKSPRLVFADGTQSIYLADMSGDGLTDLARIRNGEVCYWPNLGYGRFGAKVTMDCAPNFDNPDQFDHKRIRLADIDGSGTTDIIYLHRDGVRLYFNQSGNSWSQPQILRAFPHVDDLVSILTTDLLGNGTACLVWSSPLPGDTHRPMRYVKLMGNQKPHLLRSVKNNLGAETRVQYAPSTKFYLLDKHDGKPWITRLPFPVHLVERVETYDHISGNQFVTTYKYHHGYFDGEEREFRGFGMVEQQDTEEFAVMTSDRTPPAPTNIDAVSHVPPALTRTWFHTGAYLEVWRISRQYEHEYYREGDTSAEVGGLNYDQLRNMLLEDTKLPSSVRLPDGTRIPYAPTDSEVAEACRALKGSILRQEIYALDDSDKSDRPYSVSERSYTIEMLQPRTGNCHAVFFTHARETLDFHYERELYDVTGELRADPRVGHSMTLETDVNGNVLESVAIGYGRRFDDANPLLTDEDRQRQKRILVTYTKNDYTNSIEDDYVHRIPLLCDARTYELVNLTPDANQPLITNLFRFDEMQLKVQAANDGHHDLPYEDVEAKGAQGAAPYRRLIEHVRTLFRRDDLTGLLPPRTLDPLALPGEGYKLAFSSGLLAHIYQRDGQRLLADPAKLLGGHGPDEGAYVDLDGDSHWWIPSGRVFYSESADVSTPAQTAVQELEYARKQFFIPKKFADPFDQCTVIDYDSYDLLPVKTQDPLGNEVTVSTADDTGRTQIRNDYRVLQPYWITDANGNRTQVTFDALGLVVATAVMGKPGGNVGDYFDNAFKPNLTLAEIQDFVRDPRGESNTLLKTATTRIVYDLDRYRRCQQPPFAATLAREIHTREPSGDQSPIQISFLYSDGFGREIQKKIQAEAGDAPTRDPEDMPVVGGDPPQPTGDIQPGPLVFENGEPKRGTVAHRWVGTGRTVYNNKGKPVKKYEPFFSSTHLYETEPEMTDTGVTPILFYDPLERVVATLHPNHTYEKIVFDPWQQSTYDVSDTVMPRGSPIAPPFDPKDDPDVGGYFARLPDNDYLPTWYDVRTDSTKALQEWPDTDEQGQAIPENAKRRAAEQDAAEKTKMHAHTPTVAYFDTLGRTFLTVAHNKFEHRKPDNTVETVEEKYPTRVELDIKGNQREVRDAIVQNGDARGRIVMRYDYDMLGNRIHQSSMEAGEQWMLNDVTGKPIRAWDSRPFVRRMTYDQLRRPLELWVTENGIERLAERTVYGESQGTARNHCTRVYLVYDGAGRVTNENYDFKGNLLGSKRALLLNYKYAVDWNQNPIPNDGIYTSSTMYDALNRPTSVTTPDGSIYRPTYNEANLLDKVDVNLQDTATSTAFVTNIDYNAKGQRTRIEYGNLAFTEYEYDEDTFRLIHLKTTRPPGRNGLAPIFADATVVQDLHYIYDPVGNITRIEDAALKPVYHNNQKVEPVSHYTYDAIYRLIEAKGREHIRQTEFDFDPPHDNYRDHPFAGLNAHPNDLQALHNYTQCYTYDAVGNFEWIHHVAGGRRWTQGYWYEEDSLIEVDKKSNRLTKTGTRKDSSHFASYTYDEHGNMKTMPHLPIMLWDFKDQLQETSRQVVTNGSTPETTYYVYDANGQRVRKVTENQNGKKLKERIYLGSYEIYCEYDNGDNPTLKRETLHIMDDKQRIALVETQTEPTQKEPLIRYHLGNHLGSASAELSEDAALISYEEYHPYGTTAFQSGRTATDVSLKRYRYTGKERDEESGLNYHGARYYAPWLGLWTSCDPLEWGDGVNSYSYVHSNPIVFSDLTGSQTEQPNTPTLTYSKGSEFRLLNQVARDTFVAMEGLLSRFTNTTPVKDITTATRSVLSGNTWESAFENFTMSTRLLGTYADRVATRLYNRVYSPALNTLLNMTKSLFTEPGPFIRKLGEEYLGVYKKKQEIARQNLYLERPVASGQRLSMDDALKGALLVPLIETGTMKRISDSVKPFGITAAIFALPTLAILAATKNFDAFNFLSSLIPPISDDQWSLSINITLPAQNQQWSVNAKFTLALPY